MRMNVFKTGAAGPIQLGRVLLQAIVAVLFTALIVVLARVPAAAQAGSVTCEPAVYDSCTQSGTALVGGITIGEHCITEIGRRDCIDSDPLNECAATEVSVNCVLQSEECVDWRNGECLQTRFVYECLNEDADMSPAHLVETRFGAVQEEIDNQCVDHEDRTSRDECGLEGTVVVEGEEVRDINRKFFAREWWLQQRTYMCISDSLIDNTCGPLESDPTCTLQDSTCLADDAEGNCTDREYHYRCGLPADELATSCEPINVCVGDTCLDVVQEESTSFGHSASWLNILAEMQGDFSKNPSDNPNEVEFFRGERLTCSKAPLRDCCAMKGLLQILSMCSESAELLAEKRAAKHTRFVGTSCSFKVLGKCIKRRQHFCTYNSKFSRVFMEQYKVHAPEDWGFAHSADCTGVTIEDVANVDVDAMEFSEVVGDVSSNLTIFLSGDIADFFADRWPGADEQAEDAFQAVEDQ